MAVHALGRAGYLFRTFTKTVCFAGLFHKSIFAKVPPARPRLQ
jgi:hypothetical protein